MVNQQNENGNRNHAYHSSSQPSSPKMTQRSIAQIYLPAATITPTPALTTHTSPPSTANDHRPTTNGNSAPAAVAPPTDIIGSVIGDFGIWQLRTALIIFLCKIPASWFMAVIIFTAPEISPGKEFKCDDSHLEANQTISSNQCYVLTEQSNNGSVIVVEQEKCVQFLYDFDFKSLIMQFNLVCMRDIFVAWTQYWHLFGVLVGGVAATKMMLKLSPRTVYIIGMIVQILFGVVTGYAQDFSVHCLFRCLSAICCALMFTAGQAIFVDITAGIHRTCIVMLYDTFWSLGVILLPGLSSFFNNWSALYLGITFPTLLLVLLLQWTPDSPRWLLKNGDDRDVKQVEQMIREAAHINDRTFKIPPDFNEQLVALRAKLRAAPPPAGWLQLWSGHYRAGVHMLAAHLALAVYITNFMGQLLNLRSFGRDYRVPNTIAMGFAEILGCFVALHFTLRHNKWKWQYAGIFNVVGGLIACLGWTFTAVPLNPALKVTLWMIIASVPKASVSCAQSMMLACAAELMPLNKKAPFMFSVVTWARIWLLTAPFINVFKKIDVALSLTAFGAITVFGGICTCFLLTPRTSTKAANIATGRSDALSNKKEQSPLTTAVWTVENDVNNTRL